MYLLLGILSLFLRSGWADGYIVSVASSGSCTRGCVRGGTCRSSRITKWWGVYFFLVLVADDHLVPGLAPADLGDGVLGLVGVVMIVAAHDHLILNNYSSSITNKYL